MRKASIQVPKLAKKATQGTEPAAVAGSGGAVPPPQLPTAPAPAQPTSPAAAQPTALPAPPPPQLKAQVEQHKQPPEQPELPHPRGGGLLPRGEDDEGEQGSGRTGQEIWQEMQVGLVHSAWVSARTACARMRAIDHPSHGAGPLCGMLASLRPQGLVRACLESVLAGPH